MKNKLAFFLSALSTAISTHALADIRLPAILGSHMVIEQKSKQKFWGWADPTEKITISTSWDTTTYHAEGSPDARWMTEINTPSGGGPYTITIKGYNTIVLDDVLIGEVWDCSGQSNMEMNYNWGVKQYSNDVDSATNLKIRFFHIPRLTSSYPQDDTKAKWVVCNPGDVKSFSLVGYFFGKQLQESLHVPVGLINASWGGTPAEVWTPGASILNDPQLKEASTHLVAKPGWPIGPGYTFNAMINPITNFTIAGVIWYQGEANVDAPTNYKHLLTTMIGSWRAAWQKDFSFYIVEIAPFAGYGNSISSALLRESETEVSKLPHTGIVVIHDLVTDINDIHPKNKKDVGLRLANLALAETYGQTGLVYKNPTYKGMKVDKGRIVISFDNADNGLTAKSGTPTEFYIAGADKIFLPATATIKGNTVIVLNKTIANPVAVRFGFTNSSQPDLFNKEGLPVNIFRTDDWNDVNTTPGK